MSVLDIREGKEDEITSIMVNDNLRVAKCSTNSRLSLYEELDEFLVELNLEDIRNLKKALDKAVQLWGIK